MLNPFSDRRVVNRLRASGLFVVLLSLSVVTSFALIGYEGLSSADLAVGLFFVGLEVAAALRVALIGSWLGAEAVTIRSWFRSETVPRGEVVTFDTYMNRTRPYPGVSLRDERVLRLPMLERGLLAEARTPESQWSQEIARLNAWLRDPNSVR